MANITDDYVTTANDVWRYGGVSAGSSSTIFDTNAAITNWTYLDSSKAWSTPVAPPVAPGKLAPLEDRLRYAIKQEVERLGA